MVHGGAVVGQSEEEKEDMNQKVMSLVVHRTEEEDEPHRDDRPLVVARHQDRQNLDT